MGSTPFYDAVLRQDETEVRRLLRNKKTNRNEKNRNGWTPIIVAAWKGNEEIVYILLAEKDVDINAVSDKRGTAVFEAARGGHWHILRVLVRRHAVTHLATEDHKTALQYAVRNGPNMITAFLLNNGAGKSIKEKEAGRDETVLHLAVRRNSLFLCRKLTLAYPSLKTLENGYGKTARALAVTLNRHPKMIAVLS